MTRRFHRPALAFVAGALVVAAVVGGRAAYASLTDDVITACFKPSNGTLYLVGSGSSRTDCQPGDQPLSWNAQGPRGAPGPPGEDGADGVGVTSVALAPGADPNCPLGGSKFTSASGVTYACNGGFTGTSTSPNGAFSISLDDTGIELEGPTGRIRVNVGTIAVQSSTALELDAGTALNLDSSGTISIDASGRVSITGSVVDIN
jgi:hypothetical protein